MQRIKPSVTEVICDKFSVAPKAIKAASGLKDSRWYEIVRDGSDAQFIVPRIVSIANKFSLRIPIYCFLDFEFFRNHVGDQEPPAILMELACIGEGGAAAKAACEKLASDHDAKAFAKYFSDKTGNLALIHDAPHSRESADLGDSAIGTVHIPLIRNPFFSGRQIYLERIQSYVDSPENPILVISGLGGIGKSQLALESLYRCANQRKRLFWIAADAPENVTRGYLDIASCLGIAHGMIGTSQIVQGVRSWLSSHRDWIVVMDNADNPTSIASLLPQKLLGKLILTSRNTNFDAMGNVGMIDLHSFSEAESVDFIASRTRQTQANSSQRDAALELHKELAGFPLALEQAAAFIVDKQILNLWDYLEEFKDKRLAFLNRQMPQTGSYPFSVATTWLMNFTEVRKESVASIDLLRLTAFLQDSSPIPFSYVTDSSQHLPLALRQLIEASANKDVAMLEALAPLARLSLVRVNAGSKIYTMHPLVQEMVRDLDEE